MEKGKGGKGEFEISGNFDLEKVKFGKGELRKQRYWKTRKLGKQKIEKIGYLGKGKFQRKRQVRKKGSWLNGKLGKTEIVKKGIGEKQNWGTWEKKPGGIQ